MRSCTIWVLMLGLSVAAVGPAVGQPAIGVIVNGSPLTLSAPGLLRAGQVMIPATRTFEAFGAAAVWLPAERTVLISNRTGLTIRLRVGETVAHVNGESRALPAAPTIAGDTVLVPAQFVFGALGAWVRYDDAARTLHVASQIKGMAVRRSGEAVRVVLDATGPVRTERRTLVNPDRLVVDLHGAAFRPADQDVAVGYGGIARVRAGQFQIKPYITRIVFDVLQPIDMRVVTAPQSFALAIEVTPPGAAATAPRPRPAPASALPAPAPAPPQSAAPVAGQLPPPPANLPVAMHEEPYSPPPAVAPTAPDDGILRIQQVRVEQLGERFRVLVEGSRPFEHTVRELIEPDRLVIDVSGAVFVPNKQEIPVAGPLVTEVRAAQFQADPDITRVVIVLRRKAAYTASPSGENGNTLVIDIPDPSLRGHVVAIDAGHGGRDMGATGPTGLQEKDLVLDIAQRVREMLVRAGVRVVMTRETDTYVELAERPRTARQQGATVFVSIHGNASTRAATSGSETYYLTPQSLALAQMIQDELAKVAGLASRGVKSANFLVLRENEVPAVLVEVGYVSNLEEETRLRAEPFRQRIAEAIMRGVQRFLVVYPVPAN